jgi:hypothetical protein
MRLFLILLAVGGFLYWSFSKTADAVADDSNPLKKLVSSKDSVKVDPPADAPRVAVVQPSPTPSTASTLPSAVPAPPVRESRTVQLLNRDLPDASWFAGWRSSSLAMVPDPVTRSVSLYGDSSEVEAVAKALRDLDHFQGSCALQAWCVYVDSNVQKGWDLLAAISSAVPDGFTATAGPGAVTLDLSNDRISAAMQLIADGESVEVIQNPYVRLTHLKPAVIEAISEIPVPQTTVSNGVAQTSIDFRKVGLQFTVAPRFLGRDRVALDVVQKNGVVGTPVKIGGNEIPVVDTQSVSSTVELNVGQGIVLGGVQTSRTRHAKGLLRDRVEVSRGVLYVVLSTSSEVPRALPVGLNVPAPEPLGGFGNGMVLPLRRDAAPWDSPDGKPTLGLPLLEK